MGGHFDDVMMFVVMMMMVVVVVTVVLVLVMMMEMMKMMMMEMMKMMKMMMIMMKMVIMMMIMIITITITITMTMMMMIYCVDSVVMDGIATDEQEHDACEQADRLNKENVELRASNYKTERKLDDAMEIIKELRSKPEEDTQKVHQVNQLMLMSVENWGGRL